MIKSVYRKEKQPDGSCKLKGINIETNFKVCSTCDHYFSREVNDNLTVGYCDSFDKIISCYNTAELIKNGSITHTELYNPPLKDEVCIKYEQYGCNVTEEEIKDYENKKRFRL